MEEPSPLTTSKRKRVAKEEGDVQVSQLGDPNSFLVPTVPKKSGSEHGEVIHGPPNQTKKKSTKVGGEKSEKIVSGTSKKHALRLILPRKS